MIELCNEIYKIVDFSQWPCENYKIYNINDFPRWPCDNCKICKINDFSRCPCENYKIYEVNDFSRTKSGAADFTILKEIEKNTNFTLTFFFAILSQLFSLKAREKNGPCFDDGLYVCRGYR